MMEASALCALRFASRCPTGRSAPLPCIRKGWRRVDYSVKTGAWHSEARVAVNLLLHCLRGANFGWCVERILAATPRSSKCLGQRHPLHSSQGGCKNHRFLLSDPFVNRTDPESGL
jgi:hypothetical protein